MRRYPKPEQYNPDPAYFRELIASKNYSHNGAARAIGKSTRIVRYWLAGDRVPDYPAQFALECLPKLKRKRDLRM